MVEQGPEEPRVGSPILPLGTPLRPSDFAEHSSYSLHAVHRKSGLARRSETKRAVAQLARAHGLGP